MSKPRNNGGITSTSNRSASKGKAVDLFDVDDGEEEGLLDEATLERRDREVGRLENEAIDDASYFENTVTFPGLYDGLPPAKSLTGAGNVDGDGAELEKARRDREALLQKARLEKELKEARRGREALLEKDRLEKQLEKARRDRGALLEKPKLEKKLEKAIRDCQTLLEKARQEKEGLEKARLDKEVLDKARLEKEVAADLATLSGPSSLGFCFCSKPWKCERCGSNVLSLLERLPNSNSVYEELNATNSIDLLKAKVTNGKELLLSWKKLSNKLKKELRMKLYYVYGVVPSGFQIGKDGTFTL